MRLKNQRLEKLIFFSLIFISVVACKKKEAEEPVVCIAGMGGSTTLVVELRHHDLLIPNDSIEPDTVWIKYNAVNAGSGYDIQKIGNIGDSNVVFNNLKCGNYFITASGYDRSIGFDVTGGLGITILENEDSVLAKVPVVE
jgi:hypothetical protein